MKHSKVRRNRRKVNEAKTGPGTMGVVRDLLDVMNKNGLTKIHVTKSTLEALAAGEVVAETDGKVTKFFNVGDPDGFSTLESVGRRRKGVRTKGNRFRKVTESYDDDLDYDELAGNIDLRIAEYIVDTVPGVTSARVVDWIFGTDAITGDDGQVLLVELEGDGIPSVEAKIS